jgi:long-chain acyl-CoA synthetase
VAAIKHLLAMPRDTETANPPASLGGRALRAAFGAFCSTLFHTWCPLTIIGRGQLPTPPFLLCSNHCSHMDSAALMAASGLPFGHCAMLAAKDYFFENRRRKGLLPRLMNLIPADRRASRGAIAEVLHACRAFLLGGDRCLIMYPEGTRSATGQLQPLKKGAAMIAMELGIPIVPVHIEGTFRALPKGASLIRPARVTLRIGAPLLPADFLDKARATGQKDLQIYAAATAELALRLRQLAAQTDSSDAR